MLHLQIFDPVRPDWCPVIITLTEHSYRVDYFHPDFSE